MSMDIFERCARREITPDEAAVLLMAERDAHWEELRPRWLPRWIWGLVRLHRQRGHLRQ